MDLLAYLTHLATVYAMQLILVGTLSFLLGGAGIFNLAHIATVAVGAYASALLTLRLGASFPLALLGAAGAGVLFGLFLALLLRRLRSDHLALLALSTSYLTTIVLLNWTSVTRGPFGLPGIVRPAALESPAMYLLVASVIAALVLAALAVVLRSPYGRVMAALRDDETAALALGKRVGDVRMVVYLLSAGGAAVGGALLAHFLQFIDPATFPLAMLGLALSGAIVGGIGSIPGVLAGTAVVTFLPEALRFFIPSPSVAAPLRQLTFALLIIAVLIARPRGISGRIDVQ